MKNLVDLAIVYSLDNLIRMKTTGDSEKLAKKLGISRSNLFETISYLRDEMCAPIIYNVYKKTYEYEFVPKFYLGSEINSMISGEDETSGELMESDEIDDISGGMENDQWYTAPDDDDTEGVIIDPTTNFNDFDFDY